jgi:uncharacterized protein (TIGR02284 family)
MMATDSGKQHEMELALKSVINVLQDSQKGFAHIGEHLKEEPVRRFFLAESLKRANFRAELENELHRAGVHDLKETGIPTGTLRRVWGDVKAKLSGDDHSLLAVAEENEDAAKRVYEDALRQDLPLPVRQLLVEQQSHVVAAHDFVRSHRDAVVTR